MNARFIACELLKIDERLLQGVKVILIFGTSILVGGTLVSKWKLSKRKTVSIERETQIKSDNCWEYLFLIVKSENLYERVRFSNKEFHHFHINF